MRWKFKSSKSSSETIDAVSQLQVGIVECGFMNIRHSGRCENFCDLFCDGDVGHELDCANTWQKQSHGKLEKICLSKTHWIGLSHAGEVEIIWREGKDKKVEGIRKSAHKDKLIAKVSDGDIWDSLS